MGFLSDLGSTLVRGAADVYTFGGNELLGNPIGSFYNQLVNPQDPNAYAREVNAQNLAAQKEFAQHGISWRVKDAAEAGLSPLAALGASEPSFTPSAVVFPPDNTVRNTGLQFLSNIGQDLMRSRSAGMSENDRAMEALNLRTAKLKGDLIEEQIKASQWARLNGGMAPPNPAIPDVAKSPINQVFYDENGMPFNAPSEAYARSVNGTFYGPMRFWAADELRQLGDLRTNVGPWLRNLWADVMKE